MNPNPSSSTVPNQEFLWGVFQRVDKDQSGHITVNELQQALSNGTWNPFNAETCRLMMGNMEKSSLKDPLQTRLTQTVVFLGMFDKEKKGQISFQDFGALWKYIVDWQNCFRSFDKDGSGNIDKNELLTALQTFGYRLSIDTVGNIVKKFDRGGHEKIYFDDFIQCSVLLHNITTSFRQFDTDQDGVVTIQYEQFINLIFSSGV